MPGVLALLVCLPLAPAQAAQEPHVPPLTADEKQALATITPGRLLATVSFLASDELEGRDTPSRGFDVAAAFVAARMRGAGLTGLGPEGSYYLESEVETTLVPDHGVVLTRANGKSVPHYGLLRAGNDLLEFRGSIPACGTGLKVDGKSPFPSDNVGGPVLLREVKPTGGRNQSGRRRGQSTRASYVLNRQIAQARQHGATAVLLAVAADSPLVAMAARSQGRVRLTRRRRGGPFQRRGRGAFPVLLVAAGTKLGADTRCILPAEQKAPAKVRNVAGILPGSNPELAKEALVFSAHLDHIGLSNGSDPVYNGADDDATGVTAVLALADCFAALKRRPKRTLVFVCFWGEEKGLLGSRHFVANSPWPLDKIVCNINLEMLGRPEEGATGKSWMTGWRHSDLGELMARGAKRAGVEIFRHNLYSAMLYNRSDNASFVRKGVIAHSFSAGSLHKDYHQPSDEWQKLELEHMAKVVRGLAAGALPIALGLATPKKNG